MKNLTKLRKSVLTVFAVLISGIAFSQFSLNEATNLVVGQLLNDELDKVDVFKIENVKSNQSAILLRNNETIDLPYSSNWVFFVDDKPFANWAHACRYVFVDVATGAYQVVNKNFFPVDWKSAYTLVSEMPGPNPVDLPVNPNAVIDGLPPNPHLFAVIINGVDMDRYWNDVSAIYNTLIDVYGYTKENIFVHYDYGSSYLGEDLDGDDVQDDFDYDAYKETILHTFSEMAGESNTSLEIPELGPSDGLFIFVTDHGFMDEGHSYILLPTLPLGDWEMAEALEGINCAQIIALFEPCEIGGFKTELSDYVNYDVSCKNRSIQTASNDEDSWAELHITGGKYDEFVYYWTAAARGYYPDDDLPWEESYAVGSLPVEQYFPVYPAPNWHPGDFDPDANGDGFVQMQEAFVYATSMDTWSDNGYYYYPAIPVLEPEDPQEFTDISFEEDLMTLCGLAGHVETPGLFRGSFIIGGHLMFDPVTSPDKFEFKNVSQFYMINPEAKISILEGSHVKLQYEVKFAGNSLSNEVIVRGKLTELEDGYTIFEAIDEGQWKGLVYDDFSESNSNVLVNTTFTDCLISGKTTNLTLKNVNFTNSGIYLTASNVFVYKCDFTNSYSQLIYNNSGDGYIDFRQNNFYGEGIIKPAVILNSFPNFNLFDSYIEDHVAGIKIFNCGTGTITHLLERNWIINSSGAGITIYHSTVDLESNAVKNNDYGVMIYNRSNVSILGNPLAQYVGETQFIKNNESYEFYCSNSSFPHTFKWNAIIDEDNTEPMVYVSGMEGPFDVRHNAWGLNFDPVEDFYPWTGFIYEPVWNLIYDDSEEDPAESLYFSSTAQEADSNYALSKTGYQQVISSFPDSKYAEASMKKLCTVESYVNNDYSGLISYLSSEPNIVNDPDLAELSEFLINFCDINLENWPTAIAWFENVIQNPKSMEDSIFAIIDLGYTYFLMEQSGYKNAYSGTMTEHIPVSIDQFNEKRDYLLSLLPGDELSKPMKENISAMTIGELLQNVPNPFNGTTQIWYKLESESVVNLNVYNYTGQLVRSIDEGFKTRGSHFIEFDASGMKNGIYFYSININGQTTDSKKMTIMK